MKITKIIAILFLFFCKVTMAAGPLGIGSIKIGMLPEEVRAISSSEPVYVKSEFMPYDYTASFPKKPNEEKFKVLLQTPYYPEAFKAVLSFTDGKLSTVYVNLAESDVTFDKFKQLITEKYGSPQEQNKMKDEQCIYKNGNSFTIKSGSIDYNWFETKGQDKIKTNLSDIIIDFCPINLRYATGASKLKSLTIYVDNDADKKKEPNTF